MSDAGVDSDSDIWTDIWYQDYINDSEGVRRIFNSITTKDLNEPTVIDPNYTLLHKLVKEFDLRNKYPELLNGLFKLKHVDPSLVDIDKKNPRTGSTALMYAASRGHLELVKALIAWKANPHTRSANQMTPFFCACNKGQVEVASFLSHYITKEELELEQSNTGNTVKTEMEEKFRDFPNETKYDMLLKIICDIELRHLVEERI